MSKRKEQKMNEEMTDKQMTTIIKLIIQIIKDSKDKEDAIKKIEELLE